MFRRYVTLLCIILSLCGLSRCRADSYALLIGIDAYQQSDAINGLAGASNDAKALAKTLEEVAGLPPDHVRLLTSDGDTKPSVANITFELDQLSQEAKPGDVVFVLFSGHGIDIDGNTYLVPWDADARTASTLKRTSLLETDVRDQLSKISAKALVMAFDMCRSDPRKGSKGIAQDNLLQSRQAKDLVIQPAREQTDESGPRAVVTLFSCSPGERSWEWASKDRGYFSYYLEKGLRHEAADSKGVVRVSSLVSYLEKTVPGAVKREEGHDQTPSSNLEGNGAGDLILARVTPGVVIPDTTTATVIPTAPTVDVLQVHFQQTLAEGRALLKMHQWKDAQLKYAAALELQPKSAVAMDGLGKTYAMLHDWDDAEPKFQAAHVLDPALADPLSDMATYAFKSHDNQKARDLVMQAQTLGPKNPDVLCNLGYLNLIVDHNADAAESLFRQAMTIDPADPDYPVGLGLVYYRRGDTKQAEQYMQASLKLNPKNCQAAQYLGELYMASDDPKQAEEWFRKAMDFDPQDSGPVADLAGLVYLVHHDSDQAKQLYEKAIKLDRLNTTPVMGLAELYLSQQDYGQADRYARDAHEIDAEDTQPVIALVVIALRKHDLAGAEDFSRQWIKLDGTQGEAYEYLAVALLAQNRRGEAMTAAKKAISLGDKGETVVFQKLGLKP
jgi:tetratricopeptide (TPR) repeat protein